ncbi:short chain dehydrogenase [Thalassococcus sp. S3]|uniref:short chain dehydrogenase n=1 Tax=Thalassococcus sp. S3 TaxID=2017482 RepID=UPI0010249116|nr:short chain dehydrogenase [Thalassococcus sp. S3]QBF32521.1 short chain dehydrogenase [Thalassococcus sp. S3]
MRVIVIGAAGDIGGIVCETLGGQHDIIKAGRTTGDIQVDISDLGAVRDFYRDIGAFDAVVSCAGDVAFEPLSNFTQESFMHGLRQKVMGQVNLVLAGRDVIAEGGSFTLTSGVLDRDPVPMGTGAATANGALAGFVKSAALEMSRGVRVNVVSPGLLKTSERRYGAWFPGHKPVLSEDVGRAYRKSVEGALTGQLIIVA